MPVIRLSDPLYKRLSDHAVGFSTPAQVIEKLLDMAEGIERSEPSDDAREPADVPKPELQFYPDESAFRTSLIAGKKARVILHFADGGTEEKVWHASRFTATSNLRGNIWSGFLRGWKSNNIRSAEFRSGE